MNLQPLISVIIPVYNAAKFIEAAIQSIYLQEYQPLEIIVVDDGSTDNSADIIKSKFPKVRYVFQKNQGPASARNVGIKLAKGQLIAFLDADDIWNPQTLENLLEELQEHPSMDIIMGRLQLAIKDKEANLYTPFQEPFWALSFETMLVKKKCFEEIGYLDEQLQNCEDLDWISRFLDANKQIRLIDFCCAIYHRHATNMTRAYDFKKTNFLKVLRASLRRKRKNKARKNILTTPLVSVIMAVKNGEKFIQQAIESVLKQSYASLELVVIDGQSTDSTRQLVAAYPDIRLISQQNGGIANAYNLGIQAAKGEFISFLSHDDWWELDKLLAQVQAFQEQPALQYVVGKARMLLEPGQVRPKAYKEDIFESPITAFIPETIMVRKSLFEQIGYFNPAYPIAEDVEWFLRAKEQKIPYLALDKVLVNKRIHGENTSDDPVLNRRLMMKIMRASLQRKRQRNLS